MDNYLYGFELSENVIDKILYELKEHKNFK